MTRVFALAVLGAAMLGASSARAQDGLASRLAGPRPPAEPTETPAPERSPELTHARRGDLHVGGAEPFAAWADVSLFGGDYRSVDGDPGTGRFFVLGTSLGASMGIEREGRLSVDWGFAYAIARVAGTFEDPAMPGSTMPYDTEIERVEAQNPLMTFEWLPWLSPNARFSVGLSLAIPSAAIQRFGDANQAGPANPEEAAIFDATRSTHMVWMAMNGAWSPYRYEAERLAVALPLGVALDLGAVELAFDGALAVSVPVLGGTGVIDATAQLAAEIYGTPVAFDRGGLSLGLRAQLVGYHLGATGALFPEVQESAQPGLSPWVRVDLSPAFLTLRGVLNLGGSYGLGTETGVWAIHLGGGAAVD